MPCNCGGKRAAPAESFRETFLGKRKVVRYVTQPNGEDQPAEIVDHDTVRVIHRLRAGD